MEGYPFAIVSSFLQVLLLEKGYRKRRLSVDGGESLPLVWVPLLAAGIQEEVAVGNWQDALIQIILDVF